MIFQGWITFEYLKTFFASIFRVIWMPLAHMSIKVFFLDERLWTLITAMLFIAFLVYRFKVLDVFLIVVNKFATIFTFMNSLMSEFVGFKLFWVIKYLWFWTLFANEGRNVFILWVLWGIAFLDAFWKVDILTLVNIYLRKW